MELAQFCASSRVLIVAGKGGVGKTTVTAALAVLATRTGASVLVVEVEGKSGLASALGCEELGYETQVVDERLRVRTLTPDRALLDYLDGHGLKRISRRLVSSGAVDVVSNAVPGMKDILVLGKVKQLEQDRVADLILIDAPAAGHAVSFLMSPRGLLDAVQVGPIRKQAVDVIELLSDPSRCQVLLVTVPEETPVNEVADTAYELEDKVGVQLGPVIVNGIYPELSLGAAVRGEDIRRDAEQVGVFVPERELQDLVAAAAFRVERHALQQEQALRLDQRLPLPQIRLPFLFTADLGPTEIGVLADALAQGIAALPTPAATQ